MKLFEVNSSRAIDLAKSLIKIRTGLKKLPVVYIKKATLTCDCGSDLSVHVGTTINGLYEFQEIGICRTCAKINNP